MTSSVLVISSDASLQTLLKVFFKKIPFSLDVCFAASSERAEEFLKNKSFRVILIDSDRLETISNIDLRKCLIMGDEVRNLKYPSACYVRKPFSLEKLQFHVESLLREHSEVQIIGNSIKGLLKEIKQAAGFDTSIIFAGESGTGKELCARYIHYHSLRRNKPFVAVNCGAIPENLMESEFFGHVKGSFTGAVSDKKGFFEAAHGGSLFLDELGELSLPLQAKLLRAVQEKIIRPLGSVNNVRSDVRIISASSRNLENMVQEKLFREDLFHRLNVVCFRIPSLRERKKDILALASFFLKKHEKNYSKNQLSFSKKAEEELKKYSYPGNIRELENKVEKAVLFSENSVICEKDLFDPSLSRDKRILKFELPEEGMDLDLTMEEAEKEILSQAIKLSKGSRVQAARLLKMTPRSLKHRIRKYKLA